MEGKTISDDIPVEFAFLPGGVHDFRGLDILNFALPSRSDVYADSAYTDYSVEDALKEMHDIHLDPNRNKSLWNG